MHSKILFIKECIYTVEYGYALEKNEHVPPFPKQKRNSIHTRKKSVKYMFQGDCSINFKKSSLKRAFYECTLRRALNEGKLGRAL